MWLVREVPKQNMVTNVLISIANFSVIANTFACEFYKILNTESLIQVRD